VPIPSCPAQIRHSVGILGIDVGAPIEEQPGRGFVTVLSYLVQRRHVETLLGIDVGAVVEEQPDRGLVPVSSCPVTVPSSWNGPWH